MKHEKYWKKMFILVIITITLSVTLLTVTPNPVSTIPANHIVINELCYNQKDLQEPAVWVEIFNPADTTIDLSNWILSFDSTLGVNIFPDGTTIGSGEYLIVTHDFDAFIDIFGYPDVTVIDDDEMGGNLGTIPIDTLRLYDPTQMVIGPIQSRLVDHVDFGGGPGRAPLLVNMSYSLARYRWGYDTDNSEIDWYLEDFPTPGYENLLEREFGVALISPAGEQVWYLGESYDINWTIASGDPPYMVTLYYTDLEYGFSEEIATFTQDSEGFGYYSGLSLDYCSYYQIEINVDDGWGARAVDMTDPKFTLTIREDLNADLLVNIMDIVTVARAFGSTLVDLRWDDTADLNDDDAVTIIDISQVAMMFGWSA